MLINSFRCYSRLEGPYHDQYSMGIIEYKKKTGLTYEFTSSALSGDKLYVNDILICESIPYDNETYRIFRSIIKTNVESIDKWMWRAKVAAYSAKHKCKRIQAEEVLSNIQDIIDRTSCYF